MGTSFPNIWAAGDVALYTDPFSGRKRVGGNWSGAFMQGRTAGLNMAGEKEIFKTLSAYSISHLGLVLSVVGDVGPFDQTAGAKSKILILDKEKREYVRIFSAIGGPASGGEKDGLVVGAVMINGQKFLGEINQAIINKWDASGVFKKNI